MKDPEQYATTTHLDTRMSLHLRYSTAPQRWHTWVRQELGDLTGLRVLELGCGTGVLWREPGSLPSQLVLIDQSEAMVATASGVAPDAAGICADAAELPFPDACFDIVIANHMLYHVDRIDAALAGIHRVLRPGGRLFAATNGRDHMQELKSLAEAELGIGSIMTAVVANEFLLDDLTLHRVSSHFPSVSMHRHDDGLAVPEVEPLVGWVLSILDPQTRARVEPRVPALRRALRTRLEASGGAFHVTKSGGYFDARVPPEGTVRRRAAARLLALDADDRVFLFEGQAPDGRRFWLAPGGGLEPGEDHVTALRREIREELGIHVEPGAPVWERTHTYAWDGHFNEQVERYYVARVDPLAIVPEQLDAYTVGQRWWTLDEIRSATDVSFVPRRLAQHLAPILAGERPQSVIDVGP